MTVSKLSYVMLIVTTFMYSGAANAGDLADKKALEKGQKAIKEKTDIATKRCGSEIQAKVAFDSGKGHYDKQHTVSSVAYWCQDVVSAVGALCEKGKDEKDAILSKAKVVDCSFHEGTGKKPKFELSGNTLRVQYDWTTGNIYSETWEYLKGNL